MRVLEWSLSAPGVDGWQRIVAKDEDGHLWVASITEREWEPVKLNGRFQYPSRPETPSND